MPDVEDLNPPLFFDDPVYYAIDVRLVAIEQMPGLAFSPVVGHRFGFSSRLRVDFLRPRYQPSATSDSAASILS